MQYVYILNLRGALPHSVWHLDSKKEIPKILDKVFSKKPKKFIFNWKNLERCIDLIEVDPDICTNWEDIFPLKEEIIWKYDGSEDPFSL